MTAKELTTEDALLPPPTRTTVSHKMFVRQVPADTPICTDTAVIAPVASAMKKLELSIAGRAVTTAAAW